MDLTEKFEEYECALFLTANQKHFAKNPITLKCGHYICKGL